MRRPVAEANRGPVAEPKIERAVDWIGTEAKWQARNVDLGMEAVKAAAVAGERKAVTSVQPQP